MFDNNLKINIWVYVTFSFKKLQIYMESIFYTCVVLKKIGGSMYV